MAKNKRCAYCGTKDKNEPYRRLPNGLFSCEDCHTARSPLKAFGRAHIMWKLRNDPDYWRGKEDARKKIIDRGKPPPLHHAEANPIIRQMFKNLMKRGKRVEAQANSLPDEGSSLL